MTFLNRKLNQICPKTANFLTLKPQNVQLFSFTLYRLKQLRNRIKDARLSSPLFDTQLYTQHLEELYSKIWKKYNNGEPADHILK